MTEAELTRDDLGGGFFLYQPKRGYRFGEDAVCLAAFPPLRPGMTVLDLGCGCGAVTLLLAKREPGLILYGLELRERPAALAARNVSANGVKARIIRGDAMNAAALFPKGSFDLVVTNPPYYPAGRCRPPRDEDAAAAKTERFWDPAKALTEAAAVLKTGGALFMSHLAQREGEMTALAREAGLTPARRETPLNGRVLLEFTRTGA
ncbi:MAG: tRNA1(Val) (adenine(37)-N6)-methyltransferase [Bacillota bacterium]|jgi:tRNA1Val (adenine37-N6)-methyltransferase